MNKIKTYSKQTVLQLFKNKILSLTSISLR